MSAVLDLAVRSGAVLLLAAVNAVVAARVIDGARHGGGSAAPARSDGRRRAFTDAIKLLAKEDTTRRSADRRVARTAPALVLAASLIAIVPLALSPGVRAGAFGSGLLFAYAGLALAPAALLLAAGAAGEPLERHATMRAALARLAGMVPLALSMLSPVMLAGSLDVSAIVDAQRGTWLLGLLPRWFALSPHIVAFALFAISAHLIVGTPEQGSDADSPAGDAAIAYSGARYALMRVAEHTAMFAVCALGATVFLGGWLLPYVDRSPLAGALGPAVMLLKTYALMFALVRVRSGLRRIGPGIALRLAWTRLVPVSLVWVIAYAVTMRVVSP